MCNRLPERLRLHEVREPAAPVDLDDRDPLPVFGLESGVAADVHLPQLEPELGLESAHLCERALAQVALLSVVDDDLGPRDKSPG